MVVLVCSLPSPKEGTDSLRLNGFMMYAPVLIITIVVVWYLCAHLCNKWINQLVLFVNKRNSTLNLMALVYLGWATAAFLKFCFNWPSKWMKASLFSLRRDLNNPSATVTYNWLLTYKESQAITESGTSTSHVYHCLQSGLLGGADWAAHSAQKCSLFTLCCSELVFNNSELLWVSCKGALKLRRVALSKIS